MSVNSQAMLQTLQIASTIGDGIPSPRSRAGAQVVFTLADEDRRLFFPDHNDCLPVETIWINAPWMERAEWDECLAEHRPRVLVTGWNTPALPERHAAVRGGSVDYVCHVTGSVRQIVTRELIACGLKVSNWGTLAAPQVAEHALLLALAALRNLGAWREFMCRPADEQHWHKHQLATRTLHGKRVAIHGFGSIAREFIALLQPFHAQVTAFSEGVPPSFMQKHGASPAASLRELAENADVFIECEALTEANVGSVNAAVLSALPRGAVFVNVGRGAVVNETALVEMAREYGLRVAGDVFASEPLPPDSPIFALPGAVLSPHIGGPAFDTYPACGARALENVRRYLAGLQPEGLITTEIFDRST
ncbi:hydroxyacid dehydrogenase [Geminisphaera colitermitum]|uniref:hydroxyacid dehydrogenase n=1 Tax=Geminisphaera colitermitum TaxID=1148786 RepID=UPI0001964F4D|nr:hydroxyacid dehydrogenase [Geminisphaera colitermitum]